MPIVQDSPSPSHPALKTCTKCGESKPTADYYVKDKAKGRLYSWCKDCHNERTRYPERFRAEVEANEAARRAARETPTKVCKTCGVEKPRDHFSGKRAVCNPCVYLGQSPESRKAAQDRYRAKHSETLRVRAKVRYREQPEKYGAPMQKVWREANRDAANGHVKKYRLTSKSKANEARINHARRAKIRATVNDLTAEQWAEIIAEQDGRCLYCGTAFGLLLKPTRDHVIPVSKGGGLTKSNVVAACQPCNSTKKNRIVEPGRPKARRRPTRSTLL